MFFVRLFLGGLYVAFWFGLCSSCVMSHELIETLGSFFFGVLLLPATMEVDEVLFKGMVLL